MLTETSELVGLEIYTNRGLLLGAVGDVVFDMEKEKVYGVFVEKTNPLLVEDELPVIVPFRWMEGIGDVLILRYFPKFVNSDGSPEHLPFMKRLGKDIEQAGEFAGHMIEDVERSLEPQHKEQK